MFYNKSLYLIIFKLCGFGYYPISAGLQGASVTRERASSAELPLLIEGR
jgi:hypothetical protein